MFRFVRYFVFIILLVVSSFIVFNLLRKPNDSESLFFLRNNKIYFFNIIDKKDEEFDQIVLPNKLYKLSNLSISPNGKFLNVNCEDKEICIYDFSKSVTKIIDLNLDNPKVESFSYDNSYAIVDTGCCPGDRDKTLISIDGRVIDSIKAKSVLWFNDKNSFLISKGEDELLHEYSDAVNKSIYLYNIYEDKLEKTKVLSADISSSYDLLDWYDRDQVVISHDFYETSDEVGVNPLKTLHILLNKNTLKFVDYDYIKSETKRNFSKSGKWELVVNGDIGYLINTENNKKFEIGKGTNFYWKN